MTQQEQARLQVLNNLLAGLMTTGQAATLMGVSIRQGWRILAAYKKEGAAALAHGHRGRRAPNARSEATKATVVHLARTQYAGVNHTHMSELLSEHEGISITRSTLRRLLVSAGENSPRGRRPPKHRVRRQRMPREGMLIQLDGSYHRWLGKDGPQFTLLLAVDDATGTVVNALFCELENTRGYFRLLDGLIRRRGIPLALYVDRHAVFKHTPSPETAAGPTQFSRAMDELGIQLIFAQSPQAKGRVERTAGTFQDRLVSELRLAGVATIYDANRVLEGFLPRFNNRFKVPAQESVVAYRVVNEGMCLDKVLCFKYRRRVARDNTVRYRWRTLQLLPGTDRPTYAGAAVDVLEGLDDSLAVQHEGRDIPSQEAPPRPSVLRGFAGRTAHSPIIHRSTNGLGSKWAARLATQDANHDAERATTVPGRNGTEQVRKAVSPRRRKPTPLQTARWRAVQKAKRKGLSIRGIVRELGIHRDTAKKYMNADRPPTSPGRLTATKL
ncbi:MAG: ISNCY family transposase [Chloroflexota bacterium]|nr:ISNCY family transposase [Chloroflexota bacterium]